MCISCWLMSSWFEYSWILYIFMNTECKVDVIILRFSNSSLLIFWTFRCHCREFSYIFTSQEKDGKIRFTSVTQESGKSLGYLWGELLLITLISLDIYEVSSIMITYALLWYITLVSVSGFYFIVNCQVSWWLMHCCDLSL